MSGNHIVGFDIGGANIKAAHLDGMALSRSFPLWKEPHQLSHALAEMLSELPRVDRLAVTMTGELADCFETKAEGVATILDAVELAAEGRPVDVWQTAGEFVDPELATEYPLLVAAANWHALASWIGQSHPEGNALLIDIGSTTTDLIPIVNGAPATVGLTDVERLAARELVYTGVRRTPLIALAQEAPFKGGPIPLAAEYFASTLDLYLLSGEIPESNDNCETANGRPATKPEAVDRLCRMLCCDRTEIDADSLHSFAEFLRNAQLDRLRQALEEVITRFEEPVERLYLSGEGSFLAERLVRMFPQLSDAEQIRLDRLFSPELSTAACAYAVANLALQLA
ncbi:MAG: H4MPT-linked C1 transfer pathway protein [Planctomyces sp.]|nr:H4MPT-linked C1 transfer pathway protein [Planctomyces sp.]